MPISRLLEFGTLRNTRDLGGMRTTDGRTVASGKLIRSAQLKNLSEEDIAKISALVGTIVDFRTEGERKEHPDTVVSGVEYLHLPLIDKLTLGVSREAGSVEEVISVLVFDPGRSREYMCGLYRNFVTVEYTLRRFSEFLRLLLEERPKAVLWHCTAGKDRAGTAALILERILGVPEEDVLADYLVSNVYLKNDVHAASVLAKKATGSDSPLIDESLKYLYGADESFIAAFDDEISKRYGSFGSFVREALGLSDADVARLQKLYLN